MKNIRKTLVINPLTLFIVILFIFSGYKSDLFTLLFVFLAHELGHIFFIYLFKIKIIKIEIYPFGGVIKLYKKINYSICKNLLISSGGIIFQLLLLILNTLFIKSDKITYYNNLLLYINILPISPLDGSKIFKYIFMFIFSYVHTLILNNILSVVFLLIYIYILIINNNINMVLIFIMTINIYKEINLFSIYKNRFFLERYLGDFTFLKQKKYKKTNPNLIKLNRYSFFGTKNVQSEKEILGKMFDKQGYF